MPLLISKNNNKKKNNNKNKKIEKEVEERNSLTLEMYNKNNNNNDGSNTEQQINPLTFKIKGAFNRCCKGNFFKFQHSFMARMVLIFTRCIGL